MLSPLAVLIFIAAGLAGVTDAPTAAVWVAFAAGVLVEVIVRAELNPIGR